MTRAYDQGERVSALVDGELQGGELHDLVDHVQADEELGLRLERYALIRDALHRNLPEQVVADGGLARRVSEALADEPAHRQPLEKNLTPASPRARRWVAPVAGMAMAASVAVVAVMIWPTSGPQQGAGGTIIAEQSQPQIQGIQTVSTESIRWDRLDPDVQARLDGYTISHDEQAASRQMGIMPRHVRMTGHGASGQ